MTIKLRPFHLAFPVHNLAQAQQFYGETLGCVEGRRAEHWIDFNLYGHQIVTHLDDRMKPDIVVNIVDGHHVPIPHFGVILEMVEWTSLADRLVARDFPFKIAPTIRFKGLVGEQATMFFNDPSGNALEFKAFADDSQIFAAN